MTQDIVSPEKYKAIKTRIVMFCYGYNLFNRVRNTNNYWHL